MPNMGYCRFHNTRADLNDCLPREGGWRHAEGNSDAHIRASLLGPSLVIPVENGRLCLGRWQAIYLYEGDGPRPRTLLLQWLAGMA